MAGVTEPDAVLKVAEIEVPVNQDGTFTHTIKLDKGENIIKVTATDMVGNATKQDVIIYRTGESSLASGGGDFWTSIRSYLPLIISFIFSIILSAAIILIKRGFKKTSNRKLYVLKTIRNISIVLGGLLLFFGGYCLWKYITLNRLSMGEDYFAIAQESIDKAYIILQEIELYGSLLKITGIAIGVCALTGVISNLIMKRTINPNKKTKKGEYVCPNCLAKFDRPVKFCGKCGEKMS